MPASKRAPQQLRAERTRRRLLEAARYVFAELGYEGATVDDVARVARVSKGAFYFHFESKEEALLRLIDGWARARAQRLEGVRRQRGGAEAALEALASSGEDARLWLEFVAQAERSVAARAALAQADETCREQLAALLDAATGAALLALSDGATVRGALGLPAIAAREAVALLRVPAPLRATG
jgi:AcrR family transcriptional regulator